MQIIDHKNSSLTVCQKFFIEKSIELLYNGSIDSYSVKLNNSKSVLAELKYCLQEFQLGRIKHFQTIKVTKDREKKALIDEVVALLKLTPNYLCSNTISFDYLMRLLVTTDENNFKKLISAVEILLEENLCYLSSVVNDLEILVSENDSSLEGLEKIDTALNFLFPELISKGFSKGFLYRFVYGVFVLSLDKYADFNSKFREFKTRILSEPGEYQVIFRIDTTKKVYDSISAISNTFFKVTDNLDDLAIPFPDYKVSKFRRFNTTLKQRKFIRCSMYALDAFAALKQARSKLSEYWDVINLGLAEEFFQVYAEALVIDTLNPHLAGFPNNGNILDGKYKVEMEYYLDFTRKLPAILNSGSIQNETKEKIKSAIRYLRLGNQSTEVEHKFINYWIGLEYLFSNYESQNTIIRVKEHFINAHALAYVKRNAYSFKKAFTQIDLAHQRMVPSFTPNDCNCLENENFYLQIGENLLHDYPLLGYRALKLHKWFFKKTGKPGVADYLTRHRANLEIHFTRIYRLRNEIIHDAATNTNNEHIASNLRYYLTFILNEVIDLLAKNTRHDISIEDYFILNEISYGNLEQANFPLSSLLKFDSSIDFIH